MAIVRGDLETPSFEVQTWDQTQFLKADKFIISYTDCFQTCVMSAFSFTSKSVSS